MDYTVSLLDSFAMRHINTMQVHKKLVIRVAGADDLAAIHTLEMRCFSLDAQSPRSLRYLLARANAVTLLAHAFATPVGYVMLLFRRNSRVARLYSIAVDPAHRGHRLGERLVCAAEDAARRHGICEMRLEARVSNRASRQLFARMGYHESAVLAGYYVNGEETKEDGVRMRKELTGEHLNAQPSVDG